MTKERNIRLDLIRAVAVSQVIAVHFFNNCGFLQQPLAGGAMAAGVIVRSAMMTCVPLFLLLSGYLCGGWKWDRTYLRRLARIGTAWLLASFSCLIWRAVYLDGGWSPRIWLRDILNFSAAPYGWYVEMYVGLFLLIPVLNAAWQGMERTGRRAMLGSLMVLGMLPTLTNLSQYTSIGVQLTPDWWNQIWPLAYYWTGLWLREYPVKWGKGKCLAAAALMALLSGAAHILLSGGGPVTYLPLTYWNGIPTTVATVMLFSALLQFRAEGWHPILQKCIALLSRLSLTAYLVSWIPDQVYSRWLEAHVPEMGGRLLLGPVAVLFSLLTATVLAWLLSWPEKLILQFVNKHIYKNMENAEK